MLVIRLQHGCFPSKFWKFFRKSFLTEHLWWLFLELDKSVYVWIMLRNKFKAYDCLPHDLLFSKFEAYVNGKGLPLVLNYFSNYRLRTGINTSFSDSNGIRTHNHLVRKRTLNHLAKLVKAAFMLFQLITLYSSGNKLQNIENLKMHIKFFLKMF